MSLEFDMADPSARQRGCTPPACDTCHVALEVPEPLNAFTTISKRPLAFVW